MEVPVAGMFCSDGEISIMTGPDVRGSFMLEQLLEVLQMTPAGENRYAARNMHPKAFRVYGGQVLAQAVMAARGTVEPERVLHSQHAYFLRPGDPKQAISYEVEHALDGGSFSSRRVVAIQHGKPIFVSSLSFQRPSRGESYQPRPMDVPPPESLESDRDRALATGTLEEDFMITTGEDLDIRVVDPIDWRAPEREPRAPVLQSWMRTTGPLPQDPAIHQAVLAYMSDAFLIDVCLATRAQTFWDESLQVASLDHALWFHADVRADEWLYHEVHTEAMSGGRGLARGNFYTRDGLLVATAVQQGLMRFR
jgi:acyl-CoA thioesterase-2